MLKIDTTFILNVKGATINTLNDLEVYIYQLFVHHMTWKVLGASSEHSRYSVEYKLNSVYYDFDNTFHSAYWFSTDSYFRKNFLSAHFCLVEEDPQIKLEN